MNELTKIEAYHASPYNFDFSHDNMRELGFHFGDLSQAKHRSKYLGNNSKIKKFLLNIKNPMILEDALKWDLKNTLNKISKAGYIDNEKEVASNILSNAVKISKQKGTSLNNESLKLLILFIENLGFDGIKYYNLGETGGEAWIAFHPEQITEVFDNENLRNSGKQMSDLVKIADFLDENGMDKEANLIDVLIQKQAGKKHKCGLLNETVDGHRELLTNYKKALKTNQREYKRAMEFRASKDNPNTGDLRHAVRDLSHNCNAVKLHEMYFEDIIDCRPYDFSKTRLSGEIKGRYGYAAKDFLEHIRKAGKVSRNGWVIVSFSMLDGKIYIDVIDLHEIGVHVGAVPLLVIDLWEHAYAADFGTNREAYMDWVMDRIDWRKADKRFRKLAKGALE